MKFCKFIGDNVYILYTFLFLFKIRLEFGWNFVSLMIGRGNVMIIEVQRESKSLALIYILKYVYLWFSGSVWL